MYKQLIFCLVLGGLILGCSKEKRSNNAGLKMQEFVEDIANKAHQQVPHFIIIPQNGIELTYNNLNPDDGWNFDYMNAIDGVGIEGLFYSEEGGKPNEVLAMAKEIFQTKSVLVADYLINDNDYASAVQTAQSNGFLCFPRGKNNYDYALIPDTILNENADDVLKLSDAKNYLYLISDKDFNSKMEYLDALKGTNYDVLLIDLFFHGQALSKNDIESLKIKANGGKRLVIAYMDIGSAEKYRYYWKDKWKLHHPGWIKKQYEGYPDEFWVKFWKDDWQNIIYKDGDSYLNRIIKAGFDGVYLDNVEAYYFLYYD